MKKPIRKYWITKCILDCIIINIIGISTASLIQPLKLTLGQSLPLCNNYEALISEHENVPSYKTSDAFNDNVINDIPTDNDTCITYNTDNFADDTKILKNNETNINNDNNDSEAFNEIDNMNGKDITNDNNVTTIYLAGYDDEIFQLKRDIEERGEGTELLICFYLCKDLHYNDLGCVYTDIKKLQDVSWKYTHFFCVDNQYLKPTWCLDDVYATYNFPKRKESTDDKNQLVHSIKHTVDGINKNDNIKPMKNNVNYLKNALDHSKYHPKVHPKENYLQDDVNIDEINQKFKERHLARKHLNTRYVNPNYCYKQDYYLNTEEIGNPLTKEQKQTNISTPTTVKHTVCYNDIKDDIEDAKNLNYTIIHSTPNTILNIDNDENKDNNLDSFRQTDTTVVEDLIPATINDISKEANVIQYGNYLTLTNTIDTDVNESNNTDCELYNIHFNVSDNKFDDENLTSFKGCEADIIRPPSLEVIVEDNPLYHRCLPDVDTEQPKLDKTPLTAIYNNNQLLPLYNNDLKNSYVESNLNEAKHIFGQLKYSPLKPSDTIKPQASQLWKEINSTKLPNENYLNKILDTNVHHQNKQRNKLSTNLPEMHTSINKQSNPNVPWRINPSDAFVIPYEHPVSCNRNNISLAQLPTIPSKCNQRSEDSFKSIIKEKIPLETSLGGKNTYYIEKLSPELLQKYEKSVPSYQDSYLKDSSHKNVDVTNEKIPLENSLGVNQNYYTHKPSPKLLQKYENRLPNRPNLNLEGDLHKNVDIMTSARKNPTAVDQLYPDTDNSVKEQTYNDNNLYGHNICSKPKDIQSYMNSVYSKAHNTHMNDPIKCDNSYFTIQPNSNIVNKTLQNFHKKIDDKKDIDSANLPNFPKVPLVTYSKFKTKDIIHPYSFDYGQDASYVLKTKQNLGKITDVYSTSLCPYKYFPTKSTSCEPQKQYLNTLQPRKIDPILYATSKKVNFLSEMSYDLPLAYESTNKISPYLLNPVTSVTSLLNIKSSQKTSVMYPKQNDSVLSQYVSPVILYLPKYLPIASYTKSLYNYMDVYVLYLKYKNLFTNSLLPKSLEDKMYPYYFIKPITRYTNNFKNSQTAPINNKTGLVAPIPSLPFATDFSPNVTPAPTLPNKDYNSEVSTFPIAPLPATNTELGKNILSILSIPVSSRPILSPLYQTMNIPTTIQSLPTLLNKDLRQKAYPLRSSYPQTLSNGGVSSNRLPDLISFSPTTPYTDLSSIPVSSLPMSLKKELGTNSFSIPVSPLPISSWPISLPSNHGQRLIPEPIKTSPILPKSDLSSPDFPPTFSILPSPLPKPSLPISTLQPTTKTFPTTTHFLPILVEPDNHIKEFPSATTSLPITPKKDFSLNRFPAHIPLFPFSSNIASNSKVSVIPMSPLPITTNKEEDFTTPISSLPISSALERKPETICPTYIMPKPLYTSLPISSNIESFNNISPSIPTWPISSILDRKQKTMPAPIQSLPVSSNLGLCFKDLRTPKSWLPISSPLETKSKTLASPTLPLPSSNIVPPENHPNHQTHFSLLPLPWTPEIRTKHFHPPIPRLPISSTVAVKPKYCPGHIQSLPFSTNTDPSPKILTPPIYSLPTSPNFDLNSKSVPLPVSYFPVSSNKDISLKGFSPTDPGQCYPLTPISELKPKVCPIPIQSYPTASHLYLIPKNIPSSISPSELNTGTPKPYQYLPFSCNINRCFNVLPIPSTSLPLSPIREVAPKNISSISPSPNIGRPSNFVTQFSYSPIPSTEEVATTSCPNPVKYLTPTTGLQPNITPCIPCLPTSTYTKPGQNSFSSPCISTPSTSGLNPKPRPRVNYWPISSNLDVKPKSYTPSLPKVPVTSNINLNSKGFLPPVSNLPNSLNKYPNLKNFAPTSSSWISPSNLGVKPKEFPTPNLSLPLLTNYISSTGVPTCISPLPSTSPLEITPKIYPTPTESTISANTDSPSPVSPWPKYSPPNLYLPVLKNSDICSKKPVIDSNVRLNPTLIEPYQNHKNQPILAEIRDLRYPQQNLQPIPSSNTTPKSRVIFTNPNTNPSTSRNPFYQRPLISNNFPCNALNNVKPSLKSPDTILFGPAPFSLILHPPSETMHPDFNTYQNPEQNRANFKLMPKPQVTISTNSYPDLFSPYSLQSHPCKTSPKSTVTVEPQTKLSNYSFLPFESNQGPEIMPLINTVRPYLHTHSPSSTLHYKGKSTPESGSNVLHEMTLKPIPLPESSNLSNPYLYPLFKPIKTPSVLIPPETEKNESNITLKLENEIQEYLDTNPSDISEYLYYTNKPIFAPKLKPICSKFKLPSSSQTLITEPSDYKEKLIKVSPYNSKVPIQPSNEVLISYLPLPCRKTPINYDTKNSGSIQNPQHIPRKIYNPIEWNLHRITNTEVPKSINEIYDIADPKLTPQYDLYNKLYNTDNINKSIVIPTRRLAIARYEPNNLIKIKTNNPDIVLKTWTSRLKLLKPKIVFDEVELTTFNFIPIVNNIGNYTPEMILDTVRKYVERHYGKPIVLKGTPSFYKLYTFIDNLTRNSGNIVYLIWPTVCKCNENS